MKTITKPNIHLIARFIERAEGITEEAAEIKCRAMSAKQHDKIFTMLLKAIKRSTEKHVRTNRGGKVFEHTIIKTNYNKKTQLFGVGIAQCKFNKNHYVCKTVISEEQMNRNISRGDFNAPSTKYVAEAAYTLAQ